MIFIRIALIFVNWFTFLGLLYFAVRAIIFRHSIYFYFLMMNILGAIFGTTSVTLLIMDHKNFWNIGIPGILAVFCIITSWRNRKYFKSERHHRKNNARQ